MSSLQDNVITIETKRRVVHVPGMGECRIRGASMALEERLAEHYDRPLSVNYRHFVNQLVAGCVVTPELTIHDVDALPKTRRQRLVRAVSTECDLDEDLRRLRGSCLGADERVFAAKMWHYQRWMARFAEMVVGFGVAAHTELKKFTDIVGPRIRELSERLNGLFPKPRTSLLLKAGLGDSIAHIDRGEFRRRSTLAGLEAQFDDRLKVRTPALRTRPLDLDGIVGPRANHFASSSLASLKDALNLDVANRANLISPSARHVLDSLPKTRVLVNANKAFGVSVAGRSVLRGYGTRFDFLLRETFPGIEHARRGWGDFSRYISGLNEDRAETASFTRRWESSSHWFLLSLLTRRSSRPLLGLDEAELEDRILDALEWTVREDPDFIASVTESIEGSALLSATRRHNLLHGLEHASKGEWLDACPPLLDGLEGALWSVARAEGIVDEQQALVSRPTKSVKSVEGLFKYLSAAPAYFTFLRRQVFGTTGNPFRHGDADEGQRRQVLFGVAALVGWLEEFGDVPTTRELGVRLQAHLVALPA